MTVKLFKTELRITAPFAFLIALLLIFDKTGMMSVSVIAVTLHELGHLMALYALNLPPKSITLSIIGVNIKQTYLFEKPIFETVVAAAGPTANLLTSFLLVPFTNEAFPAALCAAGIVIGAFNLLPLSGLDGGDILNSLLSIKIDESKVNIILKATNVVVILLIAFIGVYLILSPSRNPTMLIAAVYLTVYVLLKRR